VQIELGYADRDQRRRLFERFFPRSIRGGEFAARSSDVPLTIAELQEYLLERRHDESLAVREVDNWSRSRTRNHGTACSPAHDEPGCGFSGREIRLVNGDAVENRLLDAAIARYTPNGVFPEDGKAKASDRSRAGRAIGVRADPCHMPPLAVLEEALQAGYVSRSSCTANDAPNAAGFYQWNETLCSCIRSRAVSQPPTRASATTQRLLRHPIAMGVLRASGHLGAWVSKSKLKWWSRATLARASIS
jgi:hypothetical protein